jgi:hypothetical protein
MAILIDNTNRREVGNSHGKRARMPSRYGADCLQLQYLIDALKLMTVHENQQPRIQCRPLPRVSTTQSGRVYFDNCNPKISFAEPALGLL